MVTIAAFGDGEFVLGFSLAGVVPVSRKENIEQEFQKLLQDEKYGILIVQESMLAGIRSSLRIKAENSLKPVVMPLSEEAAGDDLRKMIIRSIGVDVW